MHIFGEAARAVAAVLHLAAIGIKYAVTKLGLVTRPRLNEQELIEAYSKVAVCECGDLLRVGLQRLGHAVDDRKVVAEAVHFGKG